MGRIHQVFKDVLGNAHVGIGQIGPFIQFNPNPTTMVVCAVRCFWMAIVDVPSNQQRGGADAKKAAKNRHLQSDRMKSPCWLEMQIGVPLMVNQGYRRQVYNKA